MSTIGNYGGTITGATIGLGYGALGAYAGKKAMNFVANDMKKLKGASFAAKREFLSNFGPHKGTVNKLIKESVDAFKNPKVLAKGIGKIALIGAGIGLAVDLIRRACRKEEK